MGSQVSRFWSHLSAGGPVYPTRLALLVTALAMYAMTWLVSLEQWGAGIFSAHMFRHMMLVAIVPPFLVLGYPRLEGFLSVSPLLAALLEFLLVWGWHLPAAHNAAQISTAWYLLEQFSFTVAGVVLWVSVLRRGGELAGAGGLLLTSMHMTLLGALLVLSPTPQYICSTGGETLFADQQRGGLLMLLMGTPVYLLGGLMLMWTVLQRQGDYDSPPQEGLS